MQRCITSFLPIVFILALHDVSLVTANKLSKKDEHLLRHHIIEDEQIKQILDVTFSSCTCPVDAFKHANCKFIKEVGRAVVIHPKIPHMIIKAANFKEQRPVDSFVNIISSNRNINRIVVNHQIKQCINQYNMQHIIAPQKWLYHIKGAPYRLCDSNYIVLAERLDLVCEKCNKHLFARHLSSDQKKEVLTIIKKIGYGDAALRNIWFTKQGKIAFIDTEQIYSADLLESLGLTSVIKAFAKNQGIRKFTRELKRLQKRYGQPFRCVALHGLSDTLEESTCSCLDFLKGAK